MILTETSYDQPIDRVGEEVVTPDLGIYSTDLHQIHLKYQILFKDVPNSSAIQRVFKDGSIEPGKLKYNEYLLMGTVLDLLILDRMIPVVTLSTYGGGGRWGEW